MHVIASGSISLWVAPAILAVLVAASAWIGVRWYYSEYLSSLGDVPLFASLTSRQLRSIARSAAPQEIAPGARIVTEGEPSDGFYVIEKGAASVSVRGERKATLGPGAYFGEMAVIDRGPRSATITAEEPSTLLHLPSSALRTAVARDPAIASAIATELRERLAAAGAPAAEAAGPDAGIDGLVALSRQLRTVQHVDWAEASPGRRKWWPGR
jgi:CRP/FNR family cyclic AMP-dependent transcriptional regulator